MHIKMDPQGRIVSAVANGLAAVQAQTELLTASIRSTLLMRLGLYALSALFVITAALLVVFAPDGRETATVVIAVALFALAIGRQGLEPSHSKRRSYQRRPVPGLALSGSCPVAKRD